jgi:predicted ThiF/HesA family dinucleotide-utilizing enzyme
VTLNKSSGQITMNNAALAAATNISFTLNNSLISVKDVLITNVAGGNATAGTYNVFTSTLAAGSATIVLRNISAGSLSEAVILNFAIIHGQ